MQSVKYQALRIVQITDSHLFADPAKKLNGLNTRYSLQQVMDAVLGSRPDLIVFTGDLVDKPDIDAYLQVKKITDLSPVPVFCLPGNHDQPDLIKKILPSDTIHVDDGLVLNNWQLIFLDSYLPDTHSGRLSDDQLQMLHSRLSQHPQLSALICLHHQPVEIGSTWMDAMGLIQAEEFFAVLDQHPQVKGVIWGHIHQQFEQTRNAVKLLGSPSTCVQFKPGASQFSLDDKPPGYRWLILHNDGEIETGVSYLANFAPLD